MSRLLPLQSLLCLLVFDALLVVFRNFQHSDDMVRKIMLCFSLSSKHMFTRPSFLVQPLKNTALHCGQILLGDMTVSTNSYSQNSTREHRSSHKGEKLPLTPCSLIYVRRMCIRSRVNHHFTLLRMLSSPGYSTLR